jgi:SAM-dependent methyltransferase
VGEDLAFVQARGFGGFAAAAIAELIPQLQSRGVRRVVDVGCGAGVSTRALLQAGFHTVAIEPSPALLALAREAAPEAEFYLASAYDAALPACDAVLALGEPLTYHDRQADADTLLRHFFRKVRQALGAGGLFVFDVIEAEGASLHARGWVSGPDWAVLHETREQPSEGRLSRSIETFRRFAGDAYRRSTEVHEIRLFHRHDLTTWLEAEGFEVAVHQAYGTFELPRRRIALTATRRA